MEILPLKTNSHLPVWSNQNREFSSSSSHKCLHSLLKQQLCNSKCFQAMSWIHWHSLTWRDCWAPSKNSWPSNSNNRLRTPQPPPQEDSSLQPTALQQRQVVLPQPAEIQLRSMWPCSNSWSRLSSFSRLNNSNSNNSNSWYSSIRQQCQLSNILKHHSRSMSQQPFRKQITGQ